MRCRFLFSVAHFFPDFDEIKKKEYDFDWYVLYIF